MTIRVQEKDKASNMIMRNFTRSITVSQDNLLAVLRRKYGKCEKVTLSEQNERCLHFSKQQMETVVTLAVG